MIDNEKMYEKLIEINYIGKTVHENIIGTINKCEYIRKSLHIFSHIKQTCHMFRIYLNEREIGLDNYKELIYNGE